MKNEKLIRHRIPQLVEARGQTMTTRIPEPAEVRQFLKWKLMEEVAEFLATPSTAELIDVYEVVMALRENFGAEHFDKAMWSKYNECGGFLRPVVLIMEG